MDTARLFVGCLLDLGATRRVAELSRALRAPLDAAGWRCAWTPPPKLHLTLRFLGDTDVGTTPALSDALAAVARRHGLLKLGLRDLVAFPSRDAPRVLALGVAEGHDALGALARAVGEACVELGFPRESRPFTGHVTLARVHHAAGALADLALPAMEAGFGVVQEVSLYRSDLARAGAEYQCLSRHPLGDARPPQGQGAPRGDGQGTSRPRR